VVLVPLLFFQAVFLLNLVQDTYWLNCIQYPPKVWKHGEFCNTASYGLTCPQYFCDNSRLSYRIFNFNKTPFYWQRNELLPWLFSNHGDFSLV